MAEIHCNTKIYLCRVAKIVTRMNMILQRLKNGLMKKHERVCTIKEKERYAPCNFAKMATWFYNITKMVSGGYVTTAKSLS